MFIGHFAVAFGIKRAAPEVGLGTAIVAASFPDLVWPVLVAAGIVFEPTDSAGEKILFIYRFLVHDNVIKALPEDQILQPTRRHKLAIWYAMQTVERPSAFTMISREHDP